jgi:hypothetical protein
MGSLQSCPAPHLFCQCVESFSGTRLYDIQCWSHWKGTCRRRGMLSLILVLIYCGYSRATGIANTMDLPERMLPRIASRLGLHRISFGPYSHTQLQQILATRLEGIPAFDKQAVEFASRKVGAFSLYLQYPSQPSSALASNGVSSIAGYCT